MQGRLAGSREALSAGWKAFKRYAWVLIAVFIIDTVLTFVVGRNRVANYAFAVLAMGPLAGGLAIVNLKAVRGQRPSVGDLFAGFRDYVRWIGAYWFYVVIISIADIPLAVGTISVLGLRGLRYFHVPPVVELHAIIKSAGSDPLSLAVIYTTAMITSVLSILILLRYGFAYYELVDGAGVVESFRRSAELTRGIRLRLLGVFIVLGLFAAAGLAACGVGFIVTGSVAQLAFVYIYTQLKGEKR